MCGCIIGVVGKRGGVGSSPRHEGERGARRDDEHLRHIGLQPGYTGLQGGHIGLQPDVTKRTLPRRLRPMHLRISKHLR